MSRFSGPASPPPPSLRWEACIAKTHEDGTPGIGVFDHCCNVGGVASLLVSLFPERIQKLLGDNPSIVAAVHDVGKVSPGFLRHVLGAHLYSVLPELAKLQTSWEHRHALISEAALNCYYGARQNLRPHPIAMLAGSHHGSRDGSKHYDDLAGDMGGEVWSRERRGLIDALVSTFGELPKELPSASVQILAGLVTVADWIGSDERFFPVDGAATGNAPERAVAECGWVKPGIRPGLSFAEVFDLPGPRPLQQTFIDAVAKPGLYILEAPMGIGKTEAALYAAYKLMEAGYHHGIYFGLPTRLTSDRIHQRVRGFIERICTDPEAGVRLAHGQAWLKAYERGAEAFLPGKSWFHPGKRALLQPFAVGTIDQALLSVLNVRHAFVRAFGLAGKVVILDEVHSYDTYTGSLLDALIAQLLDHGCTVMILSATLTHERRQALLPGQAKLPEDNRYPLITKLADGEISTDHVAPQAARKISIAIRDWTDEQIAEAAVAQAAEGRCCVLIANTVARAQAWYDAVNAAAIEGMAEHGLLHSKFPAWRRADIEGEWMLKLGKPDSRTNRPAGCILVATQVIEQSVDLDADWMLSELAPTDMMLQRMGRLHRHHRPDRDCDAFFTIVSGAVDQAKTADGIRHALGIATTFVYPAYVLWRSYHVWKDLGHIDLPGSIRQLIQATYAPQEDLPDHVRPLWQELLETRRELSQYAATAMSLGLPTRRDDEDRAQTRYADYPTIDALLVKELDADGRTATLTLASGEAVKVQAGVPNFVATKHLHQNLVSLPFYKFKHAKTPPWLNRHLYGDVPVLLIDEDGTLLYNGAPTGYAYDEQRGVRKQQELVVPLSLPPTPTSMEDFDELIW